LGESAIDSIHSGFAWFAYFAVPSAFASQAVSMQPKAHTKVAKVAKEMVERAKTGTNRSLIV